MHDPKPSWVRARITLIRGVQDVRTNLSLEVSDWRAFLVSLRTQAGWRKAVRAALPLFAYAVTWIIALHAATALALVLDPRVEGADPLFIRGAVTVSALLLTRPRRWWLVLLLTLPLVPLDFWFKGLPNTAAVREAAFFVCVIIVCISVVTASLIRRYLTLPLRFASVGEVSRFMACVAVGAVPPILIAVSARAALFSSDIWLSWQIGYLGYILGIIVFTPAIVLWLTEGPQGLGLTARRQQVEGGLLLLTTVVVSVVAFGAQLPDKLLAAVLLFALAPVLVWAAVRFGPQGLASTLAVATIIAIAGTVYNRGPFVGGPATDDTLALQLFLLFVGVPLFFLAAVVQERKQASVELQASEERYRGVVESQTELISRYLPDTTLTFVNEANCRSIGLSREQLLGTKFLDLLPESEREPVRAKIRSLLAHPGVSTIEHQVKLADGSLRWQQWVDRTILDDTGQVIELQGVGRDITERKQMEQQLHESEARYRATFDSAAIGVAIVDLAGCPLEVNEYVCQMVGYTVDELRTMELRDFTHPDDVADNDALLRRALNGEIGGYQVEKRYLRKDGHVVWGRVSASLVRGQDGTPMYFVAHLEDITPRKRLERERAEQAQQLEAVMEAVPDPLSVYDTDGRIVLANSAYHTLVARLILQTRPGATVRERVQQLGGFSARDGTPLTEDDWAQTRALRGEVFAGSNAVEMMLYSPEGDPLTFSMTAAPLRDPDGRITGAVAMSRDMTAYQRLERERAEAQANVVAAREIAQHMDAFIAAAAHDIRTPVAVVSMFVELAQRRVQRLAGDLAGMVQSTPVSSEDIEQAITDVATVMDKLRDAHSGVDQMQRLAEFLFDVSRARSGMLRAKLAPCDLTAIVRSGVTMQQAVAPERRIDLEAPEAPVPVMADADRLGQVLSNYLTNALKYSPVDQPVTVWLKVLGERAAVSVADHGPGLAEEEQRRVWELFHRVSGVEVQPVSDFLDGSLGLGLYISKQLIELHPGGRVGVESVVGEGSTFWFELPLASFS